MKIAVIGTGAVGGYFGGRLAQAGEDVTFIARGAHLQAIQASGLRVDSVKGDFLVQPAQATSRPEDVGVVDCILVAVKAWQVLEAAQAARPMVGPQTFVVPLQNGVEAPGQLAAELGDAHVLGGLCRISAMIAGAGHIRHLGLEPSIDFGELDNRTSERAERLRQAFAKAGVKASVPADIQAAMWEKFVFIASVSGVGAVTRAPMGVHRSLPETRPLLAGALQEVAAVGRACGVSLAEDLAARVLANIDNLPPGTTASMQRDIAEGRPSELEAQNGAVVRLGNKTGVPAPVHEFLYACLLPQEKRARGELTF
jgi:2-dehydropantoate 2-reductase